MNKKYIFVALFLAACVPSLRATELKLAALFSDHMVLQCEKPVPVWGWAEPGSKVTIEFAGQSKTTLTDANGKWMAKLDPMPPSAEGRDLRVGSIEVHDVLVGEVWLASGQSNMGYLLSPKFDKAAIDSAAHNEVRFFTEKSDGALTPQSDAKGQWVVSSPQTAPQFSACAYYFATELLRALNIPVGIVHSSVGGTQGESWLSREAQNNVPELKEFCEKQMDAMEHFEENSKIFQKTLPEWETKYGAGDPGNTGLAKGWANGDFDDSNWQTCPAPVKWQQLGLKGGGIVWLRKTIYVSPENSGKNSAYNIGGYDESVTAYFNGHELQMAHSKPPFFHNWVVFPVPGKLVEAGPNVVAFRIHSLTENGSMWRKPKGILEGFEDKTTITDDWRCSIETRFPDLTSEARASLPKAPQAEMNNTASCLFNGKINPLVPYGIRGAIWYQGESNTNRGAGYASLLKTLVGDWRTRWGLGDFPFYIVQLANSYDPVKEPGESGAAQVREGQMKAANSIPKSGMAVTIDIGEKNIHPHNKLDVGRRLALQALAKTYGKNVPCESSTYRSMKVEGNSIRIRFDHLEGGLVAKDGPLKQFAIAGADKKFVWADAEIDGETVLVRSPQVPSPVAVRYAWANNPESCNLYNKAGLPASPFRTDDGSTK